MKKLLSLLLACVMIFALAAGCSNSETNEGSGNNAANDNPAANDNQTDNDNQAATGDKVVKIGVFEPLSGDSASGGKKEYLGMQFANYETPTVTINGEEYTVELVPADNGSTTDKAPTAASQLVSAGVSLVLGTYGSGCAMAGGPKFDEGGLAAIGVTCTNANVTAGNDYYYRICFVDDFQSTVLANFALQSCNAQVAYCLGEAGNEYDQNLVALFEKTFTAAGGTVIKDSFQTNNSDFTSYLNKAKSEGADVIFTPVSIAYATQIITQADSLGIDVPILGSDTLDDNMVLEAIKGTNMTVYVSTFYQEGGNPEFDTKVKEYINSNSAALDANGGNDTISAVTAMGYDAYYVALEAIKAAGSTDPGAIKAVLGDVTWEGVSGYIEFDDVNGDAIRDTAFIKRSTADGNWELETQVTIQ